jgi:hypothetical protein
MTRLGFLAGDPGEGPGGILAVVAPRHAGGAVLGALAGGVLRDQRLYCVDAGNAFDPYAFSGQARAAGIDANAVLDRVFVTRCFTIHQLEAVVEEMLPAAVATGPGAMVAVLGLDHLFREESLRAAERGRVLGRVVERLDGMATAGGRLVVTHEEPPRREAWWGPLRGLADVTARVEEDGAGGLRLAGQALTGGRKSGRRLR